MSSGINSGIKQKLESIVRELLAEGHGILAADESNKTADKRLEANGIEPNQENRRRYREMLFGAPGIEKFISGVILYDETFWQKSSLNISFINFLTSKGIIPGIKVDAGTETLIESPEEKITNGLEGLEERLDRYVSAGAQFTKWRAVFKIDIKNNLPSDIALQKNSARFFHYARLVQERGMVPIVEPEVILDGNHSIQEAETITTKVVSETLTFLEKEGIYLPGLILKTSMVVPGKDNSEKEKISDQEVALATVRMLKKSLPEKVGGVVFLSGGQNPIESTRHLDAIAEQEPLPWPIAFSFARALQDPALKIWQGKNENIGLAREEFLKRLKLNQLADLGEYDFEMENE